MIAARVATDLAVQISCSYVNVGLPSPLGITEDPV